MEIKKEILLLSNKRLGFKPLRTNLYSLLLAVVIMLAAWSIYLFYKNNMTLFFVSFAFLASIFSLLFFFEVFRGELQNVKYFSFLETDEDKYGYKRSFHLDSFWKLIMGNQEDIKIYKMKAHKEDYLVQSLSDKKITQTNNEVIVMWLSEILFHYDLGNNKEKELEGLPSSLKIRE